eukprot:2355101-Rhodomonas_salina.3
MSVKRSDSTVRVASLTSVNMDAIPSSARPVAVSFPSRYIPLFGLIMAVLSILGSVLMNLYHGHDIGGIPWPYIRYKTRLCGHPFRLASLRFPPPWRPPSTMPCTDCFAMNDSDTAKDPPQAGMFSYGMTVTSCIIVWVVVINYGKVTAVPEALHGCVQC